MIYCKLFFNTYARRNASFEGMLTHADLGYIISQLHQLRRRVTSCHNNLQLLRLVLQKLDQSSLVKYASIAGTDDFVIIPKGTF